MAGEFNAGTVKATLQMNEGNWYQQLAKANSAIDLAAKYQEQRIGKLRNAANAAANNLLTMGAAAVGSITTLAVKSSMEIDDAYDTIRSATGKTGKALVALQGNFRTVARDATQSVGEVGQVLADLNTRTGATGQQLEKLSGSILNIARMNKEESKALTAESTRAFNDWSISIEQSVGALDKMFVVSQQTGISVTALSEQIVKYGSPLRQLGFDFDTAAALIGNFEKAGVNAKLVLGSLRIALSNMAKEGIKDTNQALGILIDRIKTAGSTGEANAIALKVFGARAGADMAAAIREGRFEIDKLVDSLGKASGAVDKTTEDTGGLEENLAKLKNQVILAAEPLGNELVKSADKAVSSFIKLDFATQKSYASIVLWSGVGALILGATAKAIMGISDLITKLAALKLALAGMSAPAWLAPALGVGGAVIGGGAILNWNAQQMKGAIAEGEQRAATFQGNRQQALARLEGMGLTRERIDALAVDFAKRQGLNVRGFDALTDTMAGALVNEQKALPKYGPSSPVKLMSRVPRKPANNDANALNKLLSGSKAKVKKSNTRQVAWPIMQQVEQDIESARASARDGNDFWEAKRRILENAIGKVADYLAGKGMSAAAINGDSRIKTLKARLAQHLRAKPGSRGVTAYSSPAGPQRPTGEGLAITSGIDNGRGVSQYTESTFPVNTVPSEFFITSGTEAPGIKSMYDAPAGPTMGDFPGITAGTDTYGGETLQAAINKLREKNALQVESLRLTAEETGKTADQSAYLSAIVSARAAEVALLEKGIVDAERFGASADTVEDLKMQLARAKNDLKGAQLDMKRAVQQGVKDGIGDWGKAALSGRSFRDLGTDRAGQNWANWLSGEPGSFAGGAKAMLGQVFGNTKFGQWFKDPKVQQRLQAAGNIFSGIMAMNPQTTSSSEGALSGAAGGLSLASGITGMGLAKATPGLGLAAMVIGAVMGIGSARRNREEATKRWQENILRELQRVNNKLSPVSDYFNRGTFSPLAPSAVYAGSSSWAGLQVSMRRGFR